MGSGKTKLKARILDSTAMQRALNRIAHEILERNANVDELVLIGVRARGVPLAHRLAQIIKHIEGKTVSTGSLDITLYQDCFTPLAAHPIVRGAQIPCSLSNKTVILVDDLLYTGRTARAALDALVDFGRPKMIQLAVLIDRGHRELPIHADYVGKNVPTASNEIVDVRVKEIDNEEHVVILE
ncbi:MAG TPA: bifunctional pyr operon transcriptional regulator/uracil phosphoribosyltransferase PyrR [Acidobacteriota bacterium]|nr:bifunctional pyr operon transcriptional regulator/uracil phosphoribosyltransferase PyrR [Acidobacteriota bacterium]